ncbi:amino acid adenylation domain-containing protein, partial [Steroidobacter flavus]
GVLGTLKAGGAYVPLDPNYPAERLRYMIEDAAPTVILTQAELRSRLPVTSAEVIAMNAHCDRIEQQSQGNLSPADLQLTAECPVYVIYTSGSTGKPKGTAMAHRSMVNLIEWHRLSFPEGEGARVLQFAALSFDVAFQDTFSTLCTGGMLVLLDEWVRRDASALWDFLGEQHIERLFVPPLMLQSLAEHGTESNRQLRLRDVITAGEQLRISPEISRMFERLPECRLHNHYGPTETHVVTALTLPQSSAEWPTLPPIGRPIANTRIYILDSRRQPTPIGVTGEIYIGGAGVATGYLNRPELVAERFVEDPFSDAPQARMYKTGDLGRWRLDGTIDYLGRNDDQVKIRGYRIELGEIEARLALHERVREAAVIAREDDPGEKRLVAYITCAGTVRPSPDELRAHLKATLPEHMMPAAFVILDNLPLTPSGKLHRRGLPTPDVDDQVTRTYEPPQGEVEEAVAQIWRELLRLERIGRQENFFDLGGHSLLATRVVAHINHALDIGLSVRVLFERPTIEALANFILQEIAAEVSMEAL